MQERISCKWRLCRRIFNAIPARLARVALSSFSHSLRSLCFRSISRPLAFGTQDWAYLRLTDARSLASFVFRPALRTQLLVCFATSVDFTRLPLGPSLLLASTSTASITSSVFHAHYEAANQCAPLPPPVHTKKCSRASNSTTP